MNLPRRTCARCNFARDHGLPRARVTAKNGGSKIVVVMGCTRPVRPRVRRGKAAGCRISMGMLC